MIDIVYAVINEAYFSSFFIQTKAYTYTFSKKLICHMMTSRPCATSTMIVTLAALILSKLMSQKYQTVFTRIISMQDCLHLRPKIRRKYFLWQNLNNMNQLSILTLIFRKKLFTHYLKSFQPISC